MFSDFEVESSDALQHILNKSHSELSYDFFKFILEMHFWNDFVVTSSEVHQYQNQ